MKQCTKCEEYKPATTEFFARCKANRSGFHSLCKKCAAEYGRTWRTANAERLTKSKRAYATANKERLREYFSAYYAENREQIKERVRLWCANNKERKREYHRVYTQVWRTANREKTRAIVRRRRAIKRSAEGTHTAEDIRLQYERQKGKCYYCQVKVRKTYHVDHVIPLARGGSDGPENLVIACPNCNQSKNDRLPHEWPQGGKLL
jgi:5-methylcytosine-specific restriction endonuclease McrA